MSKYTVAIGEADFRNRHRMTAGQFLAAFRVYEQGDGRTRVFDLPQPVTLTFAFEGTPNRLRLVLVNSLALFRALLTHAAAGGLLIAASARGSWKLNDHGLYALNHALRNPARRHGGLNIVRDFLEHKNGSLYPTRGTLNALFAYLEIRPILRAKKEKTPSPFAQNANATPKPNAIYYVYNIYRQVRTI